jgi:hypothetical protein
MLTVVSTTNVSAILSSSHTISSTGEITYSATSTILSKTIVWSDGQTETISIYKNASIKINGKTYPFVSWGFHWLPDNGWAGKSITGLATVLPQLRKVGIRAIKLYIPAFPDGADSFSGVNFNLIGQALDLFYENKMWIYIVQDNQLRSDWNIDQQSLYSCPRVIDFISTKQQWANMVIAYSPENELENYMASGGFSWTSGQLRNHVNWMHNALKSYLQTSAIGYVPITFPMCAGYQIDPHSGENNCKILVDASDIPDFHCYRNSLEDLNASIDGWYAYSNPTRRGWWSGECNWQWDVIAAQGGICSWEYIQTMLNRGCSAAFIYVFERSIYPDGLPIYPGTVAMLNAIQSFYNP